MGSPAVSQISSGLPDSSSSHHHHNQYDQHHRYHDASMSPSSGMGSPTTTRVASGKDTNTSTNIGVITPSLSPRHQQHHHHHPSGSTSTTQSQPLQHQQHHHHHHHTQYHSTEQTHGHMGHGNSGAAYGSMPSSGGAGMNGRIQSPDGTTPPSSSTLGWTNDGMHEVRSRFVPFLPSLHIAPACTSASRRRREIYMNFDLFT
jgi:hypothetical protein